MKPMTLNSILLVSLLLGSTAFAATVPAAKKVGDTANARIAPTGSFQVIRLEGSQADSDMRPRQWDITVYDPKRANHGTTIRIKDGVLVSEAGSVRILDDARMSRFLRNFTGYDISETINPGRWKIDSTEALAKVAALKVLAKVKVTDTKMILRKWSDGDVPPIWRVRVKARSEVQRTREEWIGSVDLSAETGEVIQNDLRPERVLN